MIKAILCVALYVLLGIFGAVIQMNHVGMLPGYIEAIWMFLGYSLGVFVSGLYRFP